MKRTLAATAGTIAMIGGSAFMAAPAQAAPVFTGGLVNVTVTDVVTGNEILNDSLNDNNVGIAAVVSIAANVCDVNVGGILGQLRRTGEATCTSAVDSTRAITFTQA